MSRKYAILAGVVTGVAAVSLAAGTGYLPDPFAQKESPEVTALETPVLEVAQIDSDVTAPVSTAQPEADSLPQRSEENTADTQQRAELAARLEEANAREADLTAERQRLEEQEAQLVAMQQALQDQTEALTEKTDALNERQTVVESREADLDAREEELAHRLSTAAAPEQSLPGDASAPETVEVSQSNVGDAQTLSASGETDGPDAVETVTAAVGDTTPPKLRTFSDGPIAEVHFELNSAKLTPGGQLRAQQAAERVSKMKVSKIRIVGLTDRSGPDVYNKALSQARAEAVADIFVQSGLSRRVIEVVGMGETHYMLPISTNDGVSEPLNRCVGILVEEAVPL